MGQSASLLVRAADPTSRSECILISIVSMLSGQAKGVIIFLKLLCWKFTTLAQLLFSRYWTFVHQTLNVISKFPRAEISTVHVKILKLALNIEFKLKLNRDKQNLLHAPFKKKNYNLKKYIVFRTDCSYVMEQCGFNIPMKLHLPSAELLV